ncbi:hypothetical protein [Candidatus Poriferisodalis sp.]|uniref:hypothetical protein n=1 Tax=Candidatus Poriferisodalis sp. TaxID=3101277 RepID=UPI003C703457
MSRSRRRRRWLHLAAPALLVVLPLAGLALQSRERLNVYLNADATGTNPIEAARRAWRLTGDRLDEGSFGPIGSFVESLVHGLAVETGEALSLAPHAVLGAVRLILVGLVAVMAVGLVESLRRSANLHSDRSFVALYPLAFAAVLVANGTTGGLVQTPHTSIGAVALVLGAALAVARYRDMAVRNVAWREYIFMAALGAAAVAFDELAYLTPFVAAAFIAARALAAGLPARAALRTAASRRWVALTAGFAVVFIPARFAVARSCAATYDCSDGWLLSWSPDAISAAVARVGSALPLAGWLSNADRADDAGLDLGFAAVLANSMLVLSLLALLAITVAAARRELRNNPSTDETADTADSADTSDPDNLSPLPTNNHHALRRLRLVLALGGFGAAVAGAAALYAGLSWRVQQLPFGHAVRQGWRDTLLTQIGWSLVAAAALAALDLALRHRRHHRQRPQRQMAALATFAAALPLAAAAALTLVANWQTAQIDRYDSAASVTSLISASTVNMGDADSPAGIAELNDWPVRTDVVDYTAPPNAIRCLLLNASDGTGPAQPVPDATEQLRAALNRLMAERVGTPYCDPPPTTTPDDGTPSGDVEPDAS